MVACSVYASYHIDLFDTFNLIPSPLIIIYFIVLSIFGPIRLFLSWRLWKARLRMRESQIFTRSFFLYRMSFSLFVFTWMAVPVIYISNITNSLAVYLNTKIPLFGVTFNNVFLSILSLFVSGVIGNAGYDLLKKIYKAVRNP
jgi:hypothetical protein